MMRNQAYAKMLTAALWLIVAPLLFAGDRLHLADGPEAGIEVEILSETDKVVEYKDPESGQTSRVEAWRVLSIVRDDASMPYNQALQYLQGANYVNAAKKFSEAKKAGDQTRAKWQDAYADYYIAYCLFELSKTHPESLAKAVELLDAFVKKFPMHRLAGAAKTHLGMIYIDQKKYPEAKAVFEEIDANSGRRDLKATARSGLAVLAHAQGDLAGALKICHKAFQDKLFTAEIINLARKILVEEQKAYGEAYKVAQLLVEQVDKSLKLEAYEMLGIAEAQLKKHEDAFIHLLKAKLLHMPKNKELSNLAEFNMTACLKVLMRDQAAKYPAWEFKSTFDKMLANLSNEQRKVITSL